jgi:hypothetical protein
MSIYITEVLWFITYWLIKFLYPHLTLFICRYIHIYILRTFYLFRDMTGNSSSNQNYGLIFLDKRYFITLIANSIIANTSSHVFKFKAENYTICLM